MNGRRACFAVVGGGVSGLAAARTIARRRPDVELIVLEARARIGGNITTERRDGFLLDGGPDSFVRTKPHATALVKDLGLGDDLVTTQSRRVYLVHEGSLTEMPAGMALAIPTRLGPMLSTPVLSLGGKLRALGDLMLPAGAGRGDSREESVHDFVARRFGPEVAERLAGPLLGGIYAGDVEDLGIESTFPQLPLLEERYGSLILGFFATQRAREAKGGGAGPAARHAAEGARPERSRPPRLGVADMLAAWRWLRRAEKAAPSPFYSLKNGMGSLIEALAAELPGGSIRLETPLRSLSRAADGRWSLTLDGQDALLADAVVMAAPAHVAARALPHGALADELARIPYLSTATVFFALDRGAVEHPLDGVGFIAPRGQADIVAATWVSSKWAGRAPDGGVLVRAFMGGASQRLDIEGLSDDDLAAVAFRELERLMGKLGRPHYRRVFRYTRSNPQPVVGHLARLERIERLLEGCPGLYLAGAAYDGVGIPDCVRQGQAAAERALRERAAGC